MPSAYTLGMNIRRTQLALLLTCFLCTACGNDSPDGPSKDARGGARTGSKEKKDRGEASMKLGAVDWAAESSSAKVRGSRLSIRLTRMDSVGDATVRDELHLAIDDYKGTGDYTSATSGSRFIRVGINTKAAAAVGSNEAKAGEEFRKALSGAKHLMLMGAKITITKASDSEVSGTFSWSPPAGTGDTITDGRFRAPVRE